MGAISWFKHKFNINGVKISIVEVEPITELDGWVKGKLAISSTYPVFGQLTYKLICETTTGSGEDKKTESKNLGELSVLLGFVIENADENIVQDFSFPYTFQSWMEKKGGAMAAASKLYSLYKSATENNKIEDFYVEVTANVKGVWNSPSAKHPISVSVAH